jgi:PAS domain S-box-containing protein
MSKSLRYAMLKKLIKKFFFIKWFRNISIAKKLYFVVGIMAVLIAVELGTLFFAIHTLSAVRAFVTEEGLWSKAQKNAIYSLEKFARTRKHQDYRDFQNFMKVPLGDHKALIELLKENPDLEITRKGFIEGRNNPEDIDGMIKLIRRFHNISYINKSMTIWYEADQKAEQLLLISQRLQVEIIVGQNKTDSLLKEIDPINQRLTVLEDNFSFTMGEGARWLEGLILKLLFFITLTVELSGLILAFFVSRGITKGLKEINRVAEKITKGDFHERVTVYSKDEIGTVATSINQMTEQLSEHIKKILQSESALRTSEEKFNKVFRLSPAGITLSNVATGKWIDVNEKFLKITGYGREEIIGHTSSELGVLNVGEREKMLETIMQTGSLRNKEIVINKKSGEIGAVLISSEIIFLKEEQVIISIYYDITNAKNAEMERTLLSKQLTESIKKVEASQVRQQFFATLSHEIRTPLNGVIGFTNVLLKDNLTLKQREQMGAIKQSGDILLVLINDILDFLKMEAGKINIEITELKLADLVNSVLESSELRLQEKEIKLINQYDNSIPKILIGDPVRIYQILLNLFSNSIKFTGKGGQICINTSLLEQDEEKVNIEFIIADTGIGISSEKVETIFEPFVQSSSDTTRKYGGTGLGLSIVKRLSNMMGGTVSVKSELHKGSAFTITLPLKKTMATEISQEREIKINTDELKRLGKLKILLAEDVLINQFLAQTILNDFGFESDVAGNGKIAVELLEKNHYDLILMDLMMPEMDGFEATQHIRTKMDSPKSTIPIIALTADVTKADVDKCTEVGMNDYISKPFNEIDLLNKIGRLIKKIKDDKTRL